VEKIVIFYYGNKNYYTEYRMKFYITGNLKIKRIKEIAQKGKEKSQMTIILGRRRIGKTPPDFDSL